MTSQHSRVLIAAARRRWHYDCLMALTTVGFISTTIAFATDFTSELVTQLISAQVVEVSANSETGASSGILPPPANAQYTGSNKCFECHRNQANAWFESKHAEAFTAMPQKYQSDPECLKCHTTGFGEPDGYLAGTDRDLAMVGCEVCHGPGAGHIDAAKRFILAMPDEEAKIQQEMKESISRTPTDQVCITCHITQAHQSHPVFDEEPSALTQIDHVPPAQQAAHLLQSMSPHVSPTGFSVKTCGGCHYGQYKQWLGGKHSALSSMLPVQYTNDPECQKCHPAAASYVANVNKAGDQHYTAIGLACESCHGPALEHVRFNRRLIDSWPLGQAMEQAARQSISRGKPATTCILCHLAESHKPHPEFAAHQQ